MLVLAVTLTIGKLIALIFGLLFIGACFGFMLCAMLTVGSDSDDQMDDWRTSNIQHPTSNIQHPTSK